MSEPKPTYPLLAKYRIPVKLDTDGTEVVDWKDCHFRLHQLGLLDQFIDESDSQTWALAGPYPWDVEKFLRRRQP